MAERRERIEFRASLPIRLAVLAALLVWMFIGGLTALAGDVPGQAAIAIGFFVVFFLIFVAYYWSMAYVVDEYGVTYRGATDFEHFEWEDIVRLKPSEIPLGGYYVETKTGGFVLSHFVHGLDDLVELIAARAGLLPQR